MRDPGSSPDRRRLVATLETLAAGIPEVVLVSLVPDSTPAAVREQLRQAARLLENGGSPASGQASLFPQVKSTGGEKIPGSGRGTSDEPLVLYTDGASRGNPGKAGAGFVVLDGSGTERAAGGKFLGVCTNNVAEYRALLLGLAELLRLGARQVTLRLDSELIVKQLKGQYRVRHEQLLPLYHEVKKLLGGFTTVRVEHVRREYNTRADQLANQAIDGRLGG